MSDPIECSWQSGCIVIVLYSIMIQFIGDKLCSEKNKIKKYLILFFIVFASVYLRYLLFD